MENMSIFYLSIVALIIGIGYYLITKKGKNDKLD